MSDLDPQAVAKVIRLTGMDYTLRHHAPQGVVLAAVSMRTKEGLVSRGLAEWERHPTKLVLTEDGRAVAAALVELHRQTDRTDSVEESK